MANAATHRGKLAARGFRGSSLRSRITLGINASNAATLIRMVETGFPFDTLRKLQSRSGIAISEIAPVVGIPERTLARRKASGRFTWDESERLLRVSSIFEKAVDCSKVTCPPLRNG